MAANAISSDFAALAHGSTGLSVRVNGGQQVLKLSKMYVLFTANCLCADRGFGSVMEECIVSVGEFRGELL